VFIVLTDFYIFGSTRHLRSLSASLSAILVGSLAAERLWLVSDSTVLSGSHTDDVRVDSARNAVLHLVVELGHALGIGCKR